MGQIAEDMIDGLACSLCDCYFEDPDNGSIYSHGYPVACNECWDEDCGYQKAKVKTI